MGANENENENGARRCSHAAGADLGFAEGEGRKPTPS